MPDSAFSWQRRFRMPRVFIDITAFKGPILNADSIDKMTDLINTGGSQR